MAAGSMLPVTQLRPSLRLHFRHHHKILVLRGWGMK
uniref:Uncharacterized protein n=1 Tax=Arundo donax TaxID=35708 RepID=A0A0A9H6I0_ARUDO